MRIIEDEICLSIPVGPDTMEKRWWSLRQPPPSVVFSLQGQIAASLGPKVIEAVLALLQLGDNDSDESDGGVGPNSTDFTADRQTLGDAMAYKVFRNARLGRALVNEGEDLSEASTRLRAVLGYIGKRFDVHFNSPALVGEAERKEDVLEFKWIRPSLLHRLLLGSMLKFGGTADRPRYPSGLELDTSGGVGLWKAVQRGSISNFVGALDQVVTSADELFLLSVWAVVHLYRPF